MHGSSGFGESGYEFIEDDTVEFGAVVKSAGSVYHAPAVRGKPASRHANVVVDINAILHKGS